jgi:hypothetical protein
MQKIRIAAAALAFSMLAAPVDADASELTIRSEFEPASRPMQLDLVLAIHGRTYWGFFPGVFFAYPVAPQGFISALNDAFYIEGGIILGAFFDPTFFWMAPQAGVRWCFYLTQEWAVFAALRLGWGIEFSDDVRVHNYTYPYVNGSVGAHWHFTEGFALRLEVGGGIFGGHLLVGISFQL